MLKGIEALQPLHVLSTEKIRPHFLLGRALSACVARKQKLIGLNNGNHWMHSL